MLALTSPLRDLGRAPEYWNDARVAREILSAFLADGDPRVAKEAAWPRPTTTKQSSAPLLELDSVEVDRVLDPIDAAARPGTVTAIVGPNGAGKSTLLSLCAALEAPDKGRVLFDGRDLASLDDATLRRDISIAGPDLPLVRGTIERNVRYRMRDAPLEEVERVAALCGVDELVAELADGWRTRVAEGGRNLSAGARQRLALARAILGRPRLLLLDEADVNLDPCASTVLDRILRETAGSATVLVVTHRREVMQAADEVWHLEAGRLVEAGPPGVLLGRDTATARLFARRPAHTVRTLRRVA